VIPNVLLVVMDSVRARNTSLHGHVNETTPFLESLATESVTYTQARAPSTWSLPSHVSMFTGLHPVEHRVTGRDVRLEPGHTVWESLRDEHGHETGVFSSNPFLTAAHVGLESAFDTSIGQAYLPFEDATDPREFVREHGQGAFGTYLRESLRSDRPLASLVNGGYEKLDRSAPWLLPNVVRGNGTGRRFADAFLEWQADRDGPWAACINLMDAHQPYEPTPEYDKWGGDRLRELQADIDSMWEFNGGKRPWWQRRALEALYDGAIRQVDAVLSDLVTTLRDRGVLEDTLVIVSGDHGEGFGEPSEVRPDARAIAHGNGGSHETLLHVPLVVRFPGGDRTETVTDVCSLTDLRDLIEATVTGETDAFPPDGPVLASGFGLNDRMRSNASRHCDDLSPYEGDTRVLYEDVGDGLVRKHVTWRSEPAVVEVHDAQVSYRVKGRDLGPVEASFADLERVAVTADAGDVDRSVRRRLEDLGYA
jgi:arylsulfatase A-like enzyme